MSMSAQDDEVIRRHLARKTMHVVASADEATLLAALGGHAGKDAQAQGRLVAAAAWMGGYLDDFERMRHELAAALADLEESTDA